MKSMENLQRLIAQNTSTESEGGEYAGCSGDLKTKYYLHTTPELMIAARECYADMSESVQDKIESLGSFVKAQYRPNQIEYQERIARMITVQSGCGDPVFTLVLRAMGWTLLNVYRYQKTGEIAARPEFEGKMVRGFDRILITLDHLATRINTVFPNSHSDANDGDSYWDQWSTIATEVASGTKFNLLYKFCLTKGAEPADDELPWDDEKKIAKIALLEDGE